jgi:hypothetical protein
VNDTLLDLIGREFGRFLEPLSQVADDPVQLDQLMGSIGISIPDPKRDALLASITAIPTLKAQVDALLAQSSVSISDVAVVLQILSQASTALRALDDANGWPAEVAGFGQELVIRLIGNYLSNWHPLVRSLTALIGIEELGEDMEANAPIVRDGELVRESYSVDRFHFDRLVSLLRDPAAALRAEYGNTLATSEDADAVADKLFPRVQRVLRELGVACRYGFEPNDQTLLGEAAPFLDHALIVYADDQLAGAPAEAGLILTISAADRGDLGLVVSPFGVLTSTRTVSGWTVALDLSADVDVIAYGRHGLTLLAGASAAEIRGAISATLAAPEKGSAFVLGSPAGSRLEIGGAEIKAATSLSEAEQTLAISGDVSKSAMVISRGDGDGFISSILPTDGIKAEFDLGLAWSNTGGFSLRGGAGLEATLPIGRTVAGVTLSSVHVSLQAQDDRLLAETSLTMSASIGPVQAAVDRIGLVAALSFPDSGGNLGVADLDFGFKPPSGLGLAIDAAAVVGGGYLGFDPQKGEYSGVLQLEIVGKISVKAFGLLSTKLPDGIPGYALIVFITAEDFQPIQLGMGFKLEGIGGMFAVNRTFDEAAMREGLKNNTLALLLFPKDPVANAPQILRNLGTVFPIMPGNYIFGPMAKIGWATPTLITMDLALMLEFGVRHRLIVLGRISSILPKQDNDLIRFNMDAMGVIDMDVGTIALDAVLVDSRLLHKYVLTGSMAMRACVVPGPQAGLCLAVGGVNPHFTPPANLPKLDLITINLTSGDNPRFVCDAYFAVTANTVQFGSHSSLYAAAYGFSIEGQVGFDVLVRLLPFHFIADFSASIQLKYGSTNLFKVKVEGALEGPVPLHISAKATFEILWCDYSIHFDKTLFDGGGPPLPPAVDALAELMRALSSPDSWSAQLPAARQHGVTMRKLAADAPLALDPLGQLTVRQSVLPLNTNHDLDTFGGAPIGGARRFTITTATLNGGTQAVGQTTQDMFAPAQFFDMSDDERLASPSFQTMDSGVVFGSDAVSIEESSDTRVYSPLKYDTIVVYADGTEESPPDDYVLGADRFFLQAQFASVAKASIRTTGIGKFSNTRVAPAVKLANPGWRIVSTSDLKDSAPSFAPMETFGDASAALKSLNQSNGNGAPKWQLIPEYQATP